MFPQHCSPKASSTADLWPAFLHCWSTSCCKHHIAVVQNPLWEKRWGFGSPCTMKKMPLLLSEVAKKIRPLLLSRVASPRIPRKGEGREVSSLVPLPQTGSAATHTFLQRRLRNLTLAASNDEDYTTSTDKPFQCLVHLTINGKALTYLKPYVFTQDSFPCPPPPPNFFQKDSHSPKDICHA